VSHTALDPTCTRYGATPSDMKNKRLSIEIPERLYNRIVRVSELLGYSNPDDFIEYYLSLNLQIFDTPEE